MCAKKADMDFDHDIYNSASAMGIALKQMAKYLSIFCKEWDRFKKQRKGYEKCQKCMNLAKHQKND